MCLILTLCIYIAQSLELVSDDLGSTLSSISPPSYLFPELPPLLNPSALYEHDKPEPLNLDDEKFNSLLKTTFGKKSITEDEEKNASAAGNQKRKSNTRDTKNKIKKSKNKDETFQQDIDKYIMTNLETHDYDDYDDECDGLLESKRPKCKKPKSKTVIKFNSGIPLFFESAKTKTATPKLSSSTIGSQQIVPALLPQIQPTNNSINQPRSINENKKCIPIQNESINYGNRNGCDNQPIILNPNTQNDNSFSRNINTNSEIFKNFIDGNYIGRSLLCQTMNQKQNITGGIYNIMENGRLPSVRQLLEDIQNRIDMLAGFKVFVKEGFDNLLYLNEDVKNIIAKSKMFLKNKDKRIEQLHSRIDRAKHNPAARNEATQLYNLELQKLNGINARLRELGRWRDQLTEGLKSMVN